MTDDVELVLAYIGTTQRARTSQDAADFERIRDYVADGVEIRLAAPWTNEPWRVAYTTADAMISRLGEGINAGSSLTTETVNAVAAGPDVLVEQVSTLHTEDGDKKSSVAFLFTVVDGRIAKIRTYRNDAGLPA